MTHDELLQAINDKLAYYTNNNFGASGFAVALRSVVELHKPEYGDFPDEDVYCATCSTARDYVALYPCETIEAIEKELM